jgi:hypothetical protein
MVGSEVYKNLNKRQPVQPKEKIENNDGCGYMLLNDERENELNIRDI